MDRHIKSIISKVFKIETQKEFDDLSMEIFKLQYKNVPPYRNYCDAIGRDISKVSVSNEIPFLPIRFFKSQKVYWNNIDIESAQLFLSSGTTDTGRSHHYVYDLEIYEQSFLQCFKAFYGLAEDIVIIALLPSYLEQGQSSLIYMVDKLISKSNDKRSGFYTNSTDIIPLLTTLESEQKKTLLIGVTYALLDLIEVQKFSLEYTIIMETGGMKGRRKELTKSELHKILCDGFGVKEIHSEYGMTELLSQAYATGGEWFRFPNWMKCTLRPTNDPLGSISSEQKTGGINVIDLANVYSCSFIATQDLGRIENNRLKIMGRFDHSDTRGCNLLMVEI